MTDLPLLIKNANWPRVSDVSPSSGVIRSVPEDFQVVEVPVLTPSGVGEHLWIEVRKKNATTVFVAQTLARWADVSLREVGWAGRKDKNAVTEQWFSIQLPGRPDPKLEWEWPEGVQILSMARHDRKLKTGMLKGNRFTLCIRDYEGEAADLEKQIERVAKNGFPNYFGEQRFGREGDNTESSRRFLAGEKRVRSRDFRSTLISAARSWIYNEVLAQRVADQTWDAALVGDLLMLDGSNSFFPCEVLDESIQERIAQGDLHASGPLPGSSKGKQTTAAPAAIEQEIFQQHTDLMKGLTQKRVTAARRSLRVVPKNVAFTWLEPKVLELCFELPAGAYATSMLRELIRKPCI